MPNNVYNNPLWLAGELRVLGLFATDCVPNVLNAADGDIIDGVLITLNGAATISNGDSTPNNFGVWELETALAADTFSLRVGDPNEIFANVTENEVYAEWCGSVSDSAGAATAVVFGFTGGGVTYIATWDGALGRWTLTSNNGIDPAVNSILTAGVGPADAFNRWQITVNNNAVVYRLNGEVVASHTLANGSVNVPAVQLVGQTVDGTTLTVATDQILAYQAGLARN